MTKNTESLKISETLKYIFERTVYETTVWKQIKKVKQ